MQTNADQRKQTNAGRRNTDRRNAGQRTADFGSGNGFCIHEKNSEKQLTGWGKMCIMEKQSTPVQVKDSK